MGIGRVGRPDIIIKRKFRWTFSLSTPCGFIPPHFVKVAARPKLQIDPTEINFLHATTWLPGKAKWEPITVTYIDVVGNDMQNLWRWLTTIYNFQDPVKLTMSDKPGWNGVGELIMYDGCGTVLERWIMESCWPESIDFGEVGYDMSEEATIELSLRYSDVKYISGCGPKFEPCPCKGCDDTSAGTGTFSGIVNSIAGALGF